MCVCVCEFGRFVPVEHLLSPEFQKSQHVKLELKMQTRWKQRESPRLKRCSCCHGASATVDSTFVSSFRLILSLASLSSRLFQISSGTSCFVCVKLWSHGRQTVGKGYCSTVHDATNTGLNARCLLLLGHRRWAGVRL